METQLGICIYLVVIQNTERLDLTVLILNLVFTLMSRSSVNPDFVVVT